MNAAGPDPKDGAGLAGGGAPGGERSPRAEVSAGAEPSVGADEAVRVEPSVRAEDEARSAQSPRAAEASPGGEAGNGAYLRLPWPLVAGGLLAVLVLALAAGLYANRNLRPQVAPAATVFVTPLVAGGAVPAGTPTPAPTPSAAAAPVVAATVPAPASTPVIAAVGAATPASAPTPLVVLLATATSPPSTPTAIPTVDPALAAELDSAYQHYWQVRAEALYDLDTSHLAEVMAGDHLSSVEKFIDGLRSEGHALQTDVDHHYSIIRASNDEATIVDKYTDMSFYVDPQTHSELTDPVNDALVEQYRLTRTDDKWRVVSLVRAP